MDETKAKAQTAPAGHSIDEIRAIYHELIQFCSENNIDLFSVCKEFSLNSKSSYEEFENALRRLIYTTFKKKGNKKDA